MEINNTKALLKICNDVNLAAKGAHVLYTDVWTSMGEETNKDEKDKQFLGFSIDEQILKQANNNAIVLHCLPAYRSKEITDDVFESDQSRIFDQAENRLHVQQALLASIFSEIDSN